MNFESIINFLKRLFALSPSDLPQTLILDDPQDVDAYYDEVFGGEMIEFGKAPSRDWRPLRPKKEIQAWGDCVSFSRNNGAEIKAKEKDVFGDDGKELNFSDLDLAVGSKTTKTGNSLHRVAEYGRKVGVVLEKYAPYTRIWANRQRVINKIPKDAIRFKLGHHSWVKPQVNSLKNALKNGPLQIGIGVGNTWRRRDPIPPYTGSPSTYHAIILEYIDAEDNYHIFDQYDRHAKILRKDYKILFAKSFKDLPDSWRTITNDIDKIIKRLKNKLIIRSEKRGEVYRIFEDSNGQAWLKKVIFQVSDRLLFDIIQKCLREKRVFVGVSEKDFTRIKERIFELGNNKDITSAEEIIDLSEIL